MNLTRTLLIGTLAVACAAGDKDGGPDAVDGTADGQDETDVVDTEDTEPRSRVYLGTGEYSPSDNWHGILRFEGGDTLNTASTAEGATPSGTVPVKEVVDGNGVNLNFVHSFYVWEDRDELFASSLFTTADGHLCGDVGGGGPIVPNLESCGSIGVLSNASGLSGGQTLSRHLFGANTQIDQAHGLWIDEGRDMLYVANSSLASSDHRGVLVFHDASIVDGDPPPDRKLTFPGTPVHVFVDGPSDRLFVVTMQPTGVLIFGGASTLDGEVVPGTTIAGPATRLDEGNNQTTHNVWFNADYEQIIVGHHTNEVLFYNVSGISLDSAGEVDLAPRVLEVNDTDSDQYDWSTYGFFYQKEFDRLYVSTGHTEGGTADRSGGPNPGGDHVVRVYDGVSSDALSGRVAPSRKIHWDNWETYFPPQPLWVTDIR